MENSSPVEILGCDITKKEGVEKLLLRVKNSVYEKGLVPKEIFDIPDSVVEELYLLANLLYQNGKYPEAGEIFRHLVLVEPRSYLYAIGFAACIEELKEYALAIKAYTLASLNQPQNPLPLYRAAECAHKLKDEEVAKGFFQQVVQVAGNQKQYSEMKERALLTLKKLK